MKLPLFFTRLLSLMACVVLAWQASVFGQLEAIEDNLKPSDFQLKQQKDVIRDFKDARRLFLLGKTEKERAEALRIFGAISKTPPNKALPLLNYFISVSALSVGDFEKARRVLILSGDISPKSVLFDPSNLKICSATNALSAVAIPFTDLSLDNSDATRIIGSGAAISKDGWVLTAAHVISSCRKPGVYLPNGKRFPVTRIVPGDFSGDVALVKIEAETPSFATVAENPPMPGDDLFSIGFPRGCFVPVQGTGKYKKDYIYFGAKTYAMTIPLLPGNSGSPVYNQQGKIVGVSVLGGGDQNVVYSGATPLEKIRALIKAKETGESFPVEMKSDWEEKSLAWSFNDTNRSDIFNQAVAEMLDRPEIGIQTMEQCKENGDLRAFFWLGFHYLLLPNDSDQDNFRAFKYFEEAKDLSPDCLAITGWLKTQGIGTEQETDKGWSDILEASKKGSSIAFNRLALRYLAGFGVMTDYEKSIEYAERAIDLGDESAMTLKLLALQADFFSDGTNKPIKEIIEESYKKKDVELALLSKEKAANLFRFALYASKYGAPMSDHFLALQYRAGTGTERDIEKAIYYFQKSADFSGLDLSKLELAKIYLLGTDVPPDYEKTRFWSEALAQKGNPTAKFYYACAEITPKSKIPRSKLSELSLRYLKEAAEAGIGHAQWILADIYLTGEWVPKNAREAVNLYESALRKGCPVEDDLAKARAELAKVN